jgi:hypothetical protein
MSVFNIFDANFDISVVMSHFSKEICDGCGSYCDNKYGYHDPKDNQFSNVNECVCCDYTEKLCDFCYDHDIMGEINEDGDYVCENCVDCYYT